jgi:hypothetical protein
MDIFSIDLTPQEITLLRQSLDVITITGKDAKFVGNLQYKLETELQSIQEMITERQVAEQKQKSAELEKALAVEARKQKKAEQSAS